MIQKPPTAPDNQTIIWSPQEGPQTALLQCPVFEVFFGGARGGGKTEAMLGDWMQHSSLYGEDAIGIFVRRTRTQLSEVIARSKQLFRFLQGAKYNETKSEWTMPGRGRLRFVYLERASDAENYQGHSYTRVYIEEVTNFQAPRAIDLLRATLRSAVGVPVGMRLTGNPGGPGHSWVKQRYIDPAPQGYQIITYEDSVVLPDGHTISVKLERVFIPSKLRDNKKLLNSQPTYVLQLRQTGSEQLVKAWLDGDWNSIEGAYFSEFSYEKHVLPQSIEAQFPSHWTRFRAMDWGSAKPFSVGWYAVADGKTGPVHHSSVPYPKGTLFKYREWYGWNGKPNEGLKMSASAVGRGVLEQEKPDLAKHLTIRYALADPSIFIEDGGPSIAEMMLSVGCRWERADNKRIPGWSQIRQRLQASIPMLYFLDSCEHTIRTIELLQHDEAKPEDLDSEMEDHALDETRYACNSRPYVRNQDEIAETWSSSKPNMPTFNDLVERNRQTRLQKERAY